jgi:putative ubiquitin-RnfH superfamily antitoxin RatB of RatAB toxin-antitoxin module
MSAGGLRVEVVYATPERQVRYALRVEEGATISDAIRNSGVLDAFPEIDLAGNRVGIYGQLARPDEPLRDGDRVEIYRPLSADPKEARRKRALGHSRRRT